MYNYITVNADTNASPDDIASAVMQKIEGMKQRQIKGTAIGI